MMLTSVFPFPVCLSFRSVCAPDLVNVPSPSTSFSLPSSPPLALSRSLPLSVAPPLLPAVRNYHLPARPP
eukprot:240958-Rhodomonas_salina.5